jgi:hypothetical protein
LLSAIYVVSHLSRPNENPGYYIDADEIIADYVKYYYNCGLHAEIRFKTD